MANKFYDTCSLLLLQEKAFLEPFFCSDITLRELENIKTSSAKVNEVRGQAKKLSKLFDKYPDMYRIVPWRQTMDKKYADSNDVRIIECALECRKHHDIVFVSDDLCAKTLAKKVFGLPVDSAANYADQIYQGYKMVSGSTEEINAYINDFDPSEWETNEYLIINNVDDGSSGELRFDGKSFVPLKLPSSQYIKAKNALQRCALDSLLNPDITAVALLGGYGSGKTYLSMKMALQQFHQGKCNKILCVREPHGEGKDVGYLPGSMDEKTENFFLPIVQQLDGGKLELERMREEETLESNIPYYLKGTTYDNTVIVVDEAEDLTQKQIKLIGTRVGKNTKIIFSGDYKQSVINTSRENALVKMCDELKGNPSFACVYLGEDVRSETSKMFSTLFCD